MYKKIDEKKDEILACYDDKESIAYIEKAYQFAKEMHHGQTRAGGDLYLIHPVEVALILAQLGFNKEVIAGALLHDVVEDCGCTLDTLAGMFGQEVADLVDVVSAIDKQQFVYDSEDIYEDEQFEKASIEEQSFKKLLALGKKHPLGFCIKFADRLNNLRTIGVFPHSKQLEKVKETERWILPVAKALQTEYFFRSIANECFKIQHKFSGEKFFEHYDIYHKSNKQNIEDLLIRLKEIFASTCITDIRIKEVREYKVFQDLEKLVKNVNIAKVSQGQILKVTNYNIYLLYKNEKYKDVIGNILHNINANLHDIKIIDANIGTFTKKPYYQLEDKFKNKFNLYIMSEADYVVQRNGTMDGQVNEFLDEDNFDSLETELIRVKTKTGQIKYLPQDSTVLDFAFKIHQDVGYGFKYAIINGSKTKSPPYARIYEGDQVEIVVEKDEEGEIKYNAELKWFAYVNSALAKKKLIKYFKDRLQ